MIKAAALAGTDSLATFVAWTVCNLSLRVVQLLAYSISELCQPLQQSTRHTIVIGHNLKLTTDVCKDGSLDKGARQANICIRSYEPYI